VPSRTVAEASVSAAVLPANRFCGLGRHGSVFVDRDDLAPAAVQTDSVEQSSDATLPRDDGVRVGAALQVEAVLAPFCEVCVECLRALGTPILWFARPHRTAIPIRSPLARRTALDSTDR